MKCPCEECISLAICRHKHIHIMFKECSIVRKYDPKHDLVKLRTVDKLFLLQKVMNPTIWEFGYIPGIPRQRHPALYFRSNPQYLVLEKP